MKYFTLLQSFFIKSIYFLAFAHRAQDLEIEREKSLTIYNHVLYQYLCLNKTNENFLALKK